MCTCARTYTNAHKKRSCKSEYNATLITLFYAFSHKVSRPQSWRVVTPLLMTLPAMSSLLASFGNAPIEALVGAAQSDAAQIPHRTVDSLWLGARFLPRKLKIVASDELGVGLGKGMLPPLICPRTMFPSFKRITFGRT